MKYYFLFYCYLTLISCDFNKKSFNNPYEGKQIATHDLIKVSEKNFLLDSLTGQKNQYSQLFIDSENKRIFTFLNYYAKTIYFYDYDKTDFIRTLKFSKSDTSLIRDLGAYYIKSMDSIYLHDNVRQKIILVDFNKTFKNSISLIGKLNPNNIDWILKYPSYNPTTCAPILYSKRGLIYSGQYMWSIPDSIINKFKFTAIINLKNSSIKYKNTYPDSIYGKNMWDDPIFTSVYSDLNYDDNKLIYSLPITHNVYEMNLSTNKVKLFYAGSNYATTISSMPRMEKGDLTFREKTKSYIVKTDLYGGVKYDKYRKVFYRFLRKKIENIQPSDNLKDKFLAIIIFDKHFNYLGEKVIGKSIEWNWENSFVTEEGLNIEYIAQKNNNESKLTFEIFKPIRK